MALAREEGADEGVLAALNRTSDLLFALALWADREERVGRIARRVMQELREDPPRCGVGLEEAKDLIEVMEGKAREVGVPMALAVTDETGALAAFLRQDGVLPVSVDLARQKAFTCTRIRMSTGELAPLVQPGAALYGMQNQRDFVVFGGGIPLWRGEVLAGAVGVSGGTVEQDVTVAGAGAEAWKRRGR